MFVFFKMENQNHCAQTGKIYLIIIICLIFTTSLTSINIISKTPHNSTLVDNDLFGTGIAINIIQTLYTLYLLYIDVFGKCATNNNNCGNNCKWYKMASIESKNCIPLEIITRYVYIPIILITSLYLLVFGIVTIMKLDDRDNEITMVSIASIIIGAVGLLFIFSDIICSIKCYC